MEVSKKTKSNTPIYWGIALLHIGLFSLMCNGINVGLPIELLARLIFMVSLMGQVVAIAATHVKNPYSLGRMIFRASLTAYFVPVYVFLRHHDEYMSLGQLIIHFLAGGVASLIFNLIMKELFE